MDVIPENIQIWVFEGLSFNLFLLYVHTERAIKAALQQMS